MSAIFGNGMTFLQENGPSVQLKVFGDEFYARYETASGHTCVYDAGLGLYCYATLIDGEFVSTGVSIAQSPPAGVRRHLKEAPDVRNRKFDVRFNRMQPPPPTGTGVPTQETFGPNKGLLAGRQVNKGKVRGLTILVNFQDLQSTVTAADVSSMLNGENYTANGNYCSVREYYRLMSSGTLEYTNLVVGPLTLSQGWRYYVDNLLVEEALDLAAAAGIDMSQFDSRRQRYIDAISIMYAGDTVWEGELWPHNSTVNWQHNGYRANMYQVTGLGLDASRLTIGTFCHESGHMLCRFPDLYDYGKSDGDFERSAGMGQYCLMSAGNHLDGGHTPSPICAYLRYLAGWCPNRILLFTRGDYEAKHGDYSTALIYETQRLNEYYLAENRSRVGLDAFLPSSGLAVYHCDIKGSNEWQGGSARSHYQCGLLQADGHFDLEHNLNQGDLNDLFAQVQGEVLSDVTTPSTRMWDGSDSGFYVGDISAPGEKITFRVI